MLTVYLWCRIRVPPTSGRLEGEPARYRAARWCSERVTSWKNVSAAFLDAAWRSKHAIREAVSVGTGDLASLSAAEHRQPYGWLLRQAENTSTPASAAQGAAIKEIMRRTDKPRGLVRGARTVMFRSRMSSLDSFLTPLETPWADGCHNGAALWRATKVLNFTGSLRVVTEWATPERKEAGTPTQDKRPHIARYLIFLLNPADIVVNLHRAYRRPEFRASRHACFHTGPPATADIEGVFIQGAQGMRSLTVIPIMRTTFNTV